MTVTDVQRMVSIVRAIKKGKWTEELPPWAMNSFLHKITFDVSSNTRAVQTAEAFLILLHAANYPMKDATFLRDCGFPS